MRYLMLLSYRADLDAPRHQQAKEGAWLLRLSARCTLEPQDAEQGMSKEIKNESRHEKISP